MDNKKLKDEIDNLLAKGETQKAIAILLNNTLSKRKEEVILLSNRFSEIKRKQRIGIISSQEEQLEVNKINHSLLQIKVDSKDNPISAELNNEAKAKSNELPKSNIAQIVLATCAVITLFFMIYYNSCKGNTIVEEQKTQNLDRTKEIKESSPKKDITPQTIVQIPESLKIEEKIAEEDTSEKYDLEIDLAVEHLLSDSTYADDAFNNLILERRFEDVFKVLDIAETQTDDKQKIGYIEERRKSMFFVREHNNIDNAWVSFPRTMILTEKDSKYGLFNREGKEVCKPKFDYIDPIFFGTLYCTKLNEMYGFFNEQGEEIFEPIFSDVSPNLFDGEMLMVEKESLLGFLDENGEYIIEPIFKQVSRVWSDLVITNKEDKFGAIDLKGNTIIENKYEQLDYINSEGVFYAVNKGKGKYLDRSGKKTKNPGLK